MPLKDALQFFDEIADDESLALKYWTDGCRQRSWIIAKKLVEKGFIPQKAWAGHNKDESKFIDASPELKLYHKDKQDFSQIFWTNHVATTLDIEMPDGRIEKMVFDPVLFDGPETVKNWARVLKQSRHDVRVLDLGVTPNMTFKASEELLLSREEYLDSYIQQSYQMFERFSDTINHKFEASQREAKRPVLASSARLESSMDAKGPLSKIFEGRAWKTQDVISKRMRHRSAKRNKTPNRPIK